MRNKNKNIMVYKDLHTGTRYALRTLQPLRTLQFYKKVSQSKTPNAFQKLFAMYNT